MRLDISTDSHPFHKEIRGDNPETASHRQSQSLPQRTTLPNYFLNQQHRCLIAGPFSAQGRFSFPLYNYKSVAHVLLPATYFIQLRSEQRPLQLRSS